MDNPLLFDNWTLEELRVLLMEGPSSDSSKELIIDKKGQKHRFRKVPKYVIQFDALLETLTDIVLRDGLIVDDKFTRGWDFPGSPIGPLKASSLIDAYPFSAANLELVEPRQALVKELCVTKSLRDIQERNEASWKRSGKPKDLYLSTVLWGGAGMLARSHVFEMPYKAHPLRQRLIKATSLISPQQDALTPVLEIITTERTRLFQQLGSDNVRTYGSFSLPPIAIEVIMNSNSVEDLIPVAIQLRDKYSKLRKWLKTYEVALNTEDTKKLIKHQRKLNSVAKDINRLLTPAGGGSTNLSLGVSWLKLGWSGNPLDRLRNSFGVRATLTQLILASRGELGLKKLLSLFGEENSRLGREIHKTLTLQHSRKDP